jgi:hypothetical protein
MSETAVYEIYTKNPKTGQTGWDIVYVESTPAKIESFPNFDCVITRCEGWRRLGEVCSTGATFEDDVKRTDPRGIYIW